MPLFRESNAQKYTPKQIKFFDLYKHSTGSQQPSGTVQQAAREALAKAGLDETAINKIVFENQPMPVETMKKVASQLNQAQVFGFYHDPQAQVKNYLRKQMVKNMSIARIRKEHMLEQRSDALEALRDTSKLGKISADNKSGLNRPVGGAAKPSPRYRLPF